MEELDKKYYKIKDVAEIIGVPPTTIRYWEREFPGINPSRTAGGLRQYTPSDIEILQIIYYLLKTKGLRMEAAKVQMRINKDNISKKLKVMRELGEIREELDVMLKSLSKRR